MLPPFFHLDPLASVHRINAVSGNANFAIHYHDITMHLAYGGSECLTKYAKALCSDDP